MADRGHEAQQTDVLVIFGITGDLAKVMTFRSLYRLEKRGLLDCPIVGVAVDDWTVEQLVERARESIVGTGEQLDEEVFARLAARLSYVQGDFSDAAMYGRVGKAIEGKTTPVFYLEIPPFLFGTVIKGLSEAGLTKTARVVVEKPFGNDRPPRTLWRKSCTSTSTSPSSSGSTTTSGRWGPRRSCSSGLRTRCSSRSGAGTTSRQSRSRWPRTSASRTVATSTIRSGRCATSWSITSCRWSPCARWKRRRAGTRRRSRMRSFPLFRAVKEADPANYVRGQYDGYRSIDGVAPDSTTETYAALRLEIENSRWAGVPFFIRTGKRLPVTQTELRLVFKHPPRLGFGLFEQGIEPNQLVVKLDPSTGVRIVFQAHRADGPGPIELDMEFAAEGGEGPTPYEVLLHAAMVGQTLRFTRQDAVEETWRVMQPLLDSPPPVHPYAQGAWGPKEADELVAGHGRWRDPWIVP